MLADLINHRDLLWLLTRREIRIRYTRAVLGAAWAVLPPLVMMAVFTALNFARLISPNDPFSSVPYSVFAYCGLLPWAHFSTSLTQATPSLVSLRDLLKKSAFAREVIPLSKVLAALFDLGIGCILLLLLLLYHGIKLDITALAVPIIFLIQLVFTSGLALLLSAGNVFYRDVNYLLQVGITLAMLASPVIYPLPVSDGPMVQILRWNPMASFIDGYREALLLRVWPWQTLLPGVVGAACSIALGAGVFRKLSARFAEET